MKLIKSSALHAAHWPWPKMNLNEVAQAACVNKLYMPNIGYVKLPSLSDWRIELGEAGNSKRLWLNSLVSVHATLVAAVAEKNPLFMDSAVRLLENYLRRYDGNDGIFKDAWKDEHAVANRLFVLTAFLHETCKSNCLLISQLELLNHADRHAKWLMDDKNYVKNNHGVMMDLSLAQFSVFVHLLDPVTSSDYLCKALDRLDMMFESTFDADGCCTENSPTYHFVNYSLFSTIEQWIQRYSLTDNFKKWRVILEKAKFVGQLLLRSDRTIPLVGDSESRLGTFFPNNESLENEGVGYFPKAGLFIANLPETHITLRAGGTKFTHRHIDDLSLTLWVRGKDFVVDAGLYNYDINDKQRRWFISSRAHSGFYLESAGDVRFANFKSPFDMSRFISMKCPSEFIRVTAAHNLSSDAEVTRQLTYSGNKMYIEDSFDSKTPQRWRLQFLLHPDVEVCSLKSEIGYRLKSGDEEIFLRIFGGGRATIENCNYSPSFMKIIPSKVIVVFGEDVSVNIVSEFVF